MQFLFGKNLGRGDQRIFRRSFARIKYRHRIYLLFEVFLSYNFSSPVETRQIANECVGENLPLPGDHNMHIVAGETLSCISCYGEGLWIFDTP